MTTINITKRLKQVMKKMFNVNYPQLKKDMEHIILELNWDWVEQLNNGKWTTYNNLIDINIWLTLPEHKENCDHTNNSDYCFLDYDCDCEHGYHTIHMAINYNKYQIHRVEFLDDQILDMSAIESILDKIPSTITLCLCGKLANKNNQCNNCYIHSYIRTEEEGGDCCICLNNEAQCWSGLQCNHTFHTMCLKNLVRKTCPICRASYTETSDNIYNQ